MENAILNRMKNKVESLKILSDELRVQMALGKAEAADLLENERKILSKYIAAQRKTVSSQEEEINANRRGFLTAVESLESALNGSVPQDPKAYDAYKSGLLKKIYSLEEVVRNENSQTSGNLRTALNGFKVKMDAFRVNLALHDKDDPDKVQRLRNEFSEKLQDLRTILAKNENDEGKLDRFMEDITESFNYFQRAIGDLSK